MRTVVVIGSGGREHALAWKLSQSPQVTRLIVAPGNDGMPPDWERWPISLARESFEELAQKIAEAQADLVVVGPDNPLADGLVDVLDARGILCFGPKAGAARIEASKAFAKEVMEAAGVPTAKYFVANSPEDARKILKSVPWPPKQGNGWVLKADGLALGKGVHVCPTFDDATRALEALQALGGGAAKQIVPNRIVIEECLKGEEISWMAFCDGHRCSLLEPARDYKRIFDGDRGPNTGGMGAFSPVPGVPADFVERVRQEVFLPALAEMKKRGTPFLGLLYAGLMVDFSAGKFWVLEFNSRFGDPETQVLMARMKDDFYTWCEAVARGDLRKMPAQVPFKSESAVVVVAAAQGYPDQPAKGDTITLADVSGGLSSGRDVPEVFFAGVVRRSGRLMTAGGRVLGVMGMGVTLNEARSQAYSRLERVSFPGMQIRTDIAKL